MTTPPVAITVHVDPLDDDVDYTRGMVVGLLRGAGITVRGVTADTVDAELLARLTREAIHPADHELLDEPRRPVDHEAARARAVEGL